MPLTVHALVHTLPLSGGPPFNQIRVGSQNANGILRVQVMTIWTRVLDWFVWWFSKGERPTQPHSYKEKDREPRTGNGTFCTLSLPLRFRLRTRATMGQKCLNVNEGCSNQKAAELNNAFFVLKVLVARGPPLCRLWNQSRVVSCTRKLPADGLQDLVYVCSMCTKLHGVMLAPNMHGPQRGNSSSGHYPLL